LLIYDCTFLTYIKREREREREFGEG
jgi:hypothetical protein